MSIAVTRVPLSARPKDLAMFIYFVIHVPITAMMDLVPIYPSFIRSHIGPLIKFGAYYVDNYRDPLMADMSLVWFKTFLHCEGLFQLPIFVYAAWALFHNRKSADLWICVYSAHVITTALPCLTTFILGKDSDFIFPVSDSERLLLSSFYVPWVFFPLWMLYVCFQRVRSYEAAATAPTLRQKKQL